MTAAQLSHQASSREDLPRQLATIGAYLLTLAVNGAANVLPLNGQTTAEISDRYQVYVVPAGYVFGIWGVIYLGLGAFTIYQAARGDDPLVRRLAWLPAVTGLLNAAWIVCFHYELFPLSVAVMLALLLGLLVIYRRLWEVRDQADRAASWAVRIPFSIYVGWISVAAVANIAQTLAALGFEPSLIPGEWLAAIVLLLLAVATGRFVVRYGDAAYGLVIVWALAGIAVKEAATPVLPWVAAASAAAIAAVAIVRLVISDRRDATGLSSAR